MTSQHSTSRLVRTIWDQEGSWSLLFESFTQQVHAGLSRLDIDAWLKQVFEPPPGQLDMFTTQGITLEHVHWSKLTEFLCDCYYAQRARRPFPNPPPDSIWDLIDLSQSEGAHAPYPLRTRAIQDSVPLAMLPLEQRLLSLGGRRLVYIGGESDVPALLSRGKAFAGRAKLIEGEPSRCHSNAARIWALSQDHYTITTGYALSGDGLWRQHSFIVRRHPTKRQRPIIETTVRRAMYFAYVLNDQEAREFSHAEIGDLAPELINREERSLLVTGYQGR